MTLPDEGTDSIEANWLFGKVDEATESCQSSDVEFVTKVIILVCVICFGLE